MKNRAISIFFGIVLFACAFTTIGYNAVEGNIEYTDPVDDTDEGGLENYAVWEEADITSMSADVSDDPIILQLTTAGGIYYTSTFMDHNYYFYLDISGDDNVDVTVTITRDNKYISGGQISGSNQPLTGVSGDDSNTLEVEVPLELFSSAPSIDDVWAMSEVKDGSDWVRDYVNRDFQGEEEPPVEITPPSDDVDPKTDNPTNDDLDVIISSFDMEFSSTDNTYDYQITATGSASDDVTRMYYTIWSYSEGHGASYETWEESPIDEEHSYGDHYYKEEFIGTGAGGSYSTWKWTFHSQGPLDDSNKDRYEDPETYWEGLDSLILYIRGYDSDGAWDQDSEDITEEYTGRSSSTGDDDDTSTDDDVSDDDESDDDTVEEDDDDGESDDSPAQGLVLISLTLIGIVGTSVVLKRRKRDY